MIGNFRIRAGTEQVFRIKSGQLFPQGDFVFPVPFDDLSDDFVMINLRS